MPDPITPDTVRALIADAGPEDWRAINGVNDPDPAWGSFPMVVTEPSGAPDDGGDEVAIVRNRRNGDAALMAASKRIALAYLAVCAERDRLREIADARGLIRREIKAALGAPDDQAPMVQIAARVAAERDRLARVLDNPGDYVQTWKPTYNELVGIAHAQTVTVTVPSVVIRDHLRARLEGDRAGGSDV